MGGSHFFENRRFLLLWVPYENRPGSYYYFITRGLGEPIRVSRFFSKNINWFSKAMVLTNLIIVSFLIGSHNPDIKIINYKKILKNTLVIGKNGNFIIKILFF